MGGFAPLGFWRSSRRYGPGSVNRCSKSGSRRIWQMRSGVLAVPPHVNGRGGCIIFWAATVRVSGSSLEPLY
eukprot:7166715-Pyramimonas_sp.AAC.1